MEMFMHGPVRRNTAPSPRSDFKNTRLVLDWPGAPDYRTEYINIVIYVALYAHPAAGSLIKGLPTSPVATRLVNQLISVANNSKSLFVRPRFFTLLLNNMANSNSMYLIYRIE